MAISASSVTHAIQTVTHHHNTHPSAPMQRRQSFQQQLAQAAGKSGTGTPASGGQSATGPTSSGGLLSADLLKAVQTIG